MPVRCITFDLDDTLWSVDDVMARAEQAFYAWVSDHYPRITESFSPQALVTHRRAYAGQFPELRHDFTELRQRWLAHLAERFAYGPELVEEGFRVYWEQRNAVRLFEPVPAVLAELAARYSLGTITNGNADVHYIGIGHHFDFVMTAARAGVPKPEAGIFHAALEQAGMTPDVAVHVGDDPHLDVGGAQGVGMRTVWVNAAARPWPGGPPPDAEVRHLGELGSVLAAWADD
ncbi:MAG: HAD family hydrolase [Gammaproteobacteria bacterium]|nr:HAD family hydrolase [Gammaproteobacteria bacterium]